MKRSFLISLFLVVAISISFFTFNSNNNNLRVADNFSVTKLETSISGNLTNNVVLLRFKGEEDQISTTNTNLNKTYYQAINEVLNTSEISLHNYIKAVSNNKVNVNSNIVSNSNTSIVAENERGYYLPYSSDN